MKKAILSIAAFCALYINAQDVTVSEPVQLLRGVESEAYNPVLNQDGSELLYSGDNYQGLKVYSFPSNSSKVISTADFAGYHPAFTASGEIVYTTREMKNNKKVRTLMKYNLSKDANQIVSKNTGVNVYTKGSNVIVNVNGTEKTYSPVESQAGYIWPSLSPDGKKVMFYAAGKGIVIMTIDGKLLNMLGNYTSPVWYGNDYVVAQNSKDDGHQYSSSQIMLLKADGSFTKELTNPLSMAMNPTASSIEVGKIAYNTIDGRLFLINVSIK